MILALLFIAACFLAFSNGANDNFKGVATLFGSNTTNYRTAIRWGTWSTFLGSVAALVLAETLIRNFSGRGLVPDTLTTNPSFALSIALGSASTVFVATRFGMPISTTHSLVGALLGSGVMAVGSAFDFARLASLFLVPLVASPLIAATMSVIAYVIFRKTRLSMGITEDTCICVRENIPETEKVLPGSRNLVRGIQTGNKAEGEAQHRCTATYTGELLGISAQRILDTAHFASAGIVSFARGLNDAPKIAGLLLVISAMDLSWGLLAIAAAMAVGGLSNARKVGMTIGKKITPMNHGQGFTANLITGLLVTTASIHGLPVSTTHVSVGSIFGISRVTGEARGTVIRDIIISWVLTLPIAAVLSAFAYRIIRLLSL